MSVGAKARRRLLPGIYRVTWKGGTRSVAAVGVASNGDRWIAPVHWVSPSKDGHAWRFVESVEPLIECPTQTLYVRRVDKTRG